MTSARKQSKAGFTLLEILIAGTIFALSIVGLVQTRTTSLRSVYESETLFRALQLAQEKMVELEFKYQKLIDRFGVKEGTFTTDNGTFEAPNDMFKWSVALKESAVKLGRADLLKILLSFGMEPEVAEAQLDQQRLVLTNLNKVIKENYAELALLVEWEKYGRKSKLPLTTYLIPEKPKIQLTTVAEDEE